MVANANNKKRNEKAQRQSLQPTGWQSLLQMTKKDLNGCHMHNMNIKKINHKVLFRNLVFLLLRSPRLLYFGKYYQHI